MTKAQPRKARPHPARGVDRRSRIPTTLDPVMARLQAFAELESNWDSYGACQISQRAIDGARDLIETLASQAHCTQQSLVPYAVVPVPTGGVQLEWRANRVELDIEIRPDGSMASLFIDRSGPRTTYQEDERPTIGAASKTHCAQLAEMVRLTEHRA